jgi:hypothetical protein
VKKKYKASSVSKSPPTRYVYFQCLIPMLLPSTPFHFNIEIGTTRMCLGRPHPSCHPASRLAPVPAPACPVVPSNRDIKTCSIFPALSFPCLHLRKLCATSKVLQFQSLIYLHGPSLSPRPPSGFGHLPSLQRPPVHFLLTHYFSSVNNCNTHIVLSTHLYLRLHFSSLFNPLRT